MIDFDDVDMTNKWAVLRRIKDDLILKNGLVMDDVDEHKPYGGYYRFLGSEREKFLELFYKELDVELSGNINPKFMIFAPGQKVSFQYHNRRSEIWRVIYGEIEAFYGDSDELGDYKIYELGEILNFPLGARHKAGASSKGWAIAAEIWKHEDPSNLSDESDIVRLSDDYGRA